MKTTRMCRRIVALAGLAAIAASASALSVDPEITIDRALNSPTLAVRYTGATATLVELRIGGESVGTREVSGARSGGETTFTIDLDALKNGDNLVEVRLFDRTGKLVGSDKTNISIERGAARGAVFVATPKAGATVLGPVEINVGFGESLGRSYVSFFVDGQFKSMTNFPPFTFVWDTEKETNGWHDIEAWAIDERNETHKTGAVRLFVNNPGGRTDRVGVPVHGIAPTRNPPSAALLGAAAGVRALGVTAGAIRPRVAAPQGLPPSTVARLVPISNSVRAAVSGAISVRPLLLSGAVATGPRSLVPTGRRLAPVVKAPAAVAKPVTSTKPPLATPTQVAPVARTAVPISSPAASTRAASQAVQVAAVEMTMVAVTVGTRLPGLGMFPVLLDGMPVRFDVPTRTEDGLALAPLRAIVEKAGGSVEWISATKTVRAGASGHTFRTSDRPDGGPRRRRQSRAGEGSRNHRRPHRRPPLLPPRRLGNGREVRQGDGQRGPVDEEVRDARRGSVKTLAHSPCPILFAG